MSLAFATTAVLALAVPAVLWVLFFRGGIVPHAPLARAAASGSAAEVRELLENGAPPESPSESLSALVWAARAGRADNVRLLLQAGADPDRRDSGRNGWTPLLHAVHKRAPVSVRVLIAAGADPSRPAPNGLTPLMLAASQGEVESFEVLLAAGADPYARKPNGETVLTHAVLGGKPRIVRALLRRAPDLRLRNTAEDWGARTLAWVRGRSEVLDVIEGKR
ncbi:MAG TPA: ankyrin repeat domain-containing protein [Thermoanaerobaculia bacterium]|nr:ankyrin repeat domain-containing protein [Thermoanaerobaculia bacterium]